MIYNNKNIKTNNNKMLRSWIPFEKLNFKELAELLKNNEVI